MLAQRLVGPLHHRVIVTGEVVVDRFVDALVDAVIAYPR